MHVIARDAQRLEVGEVVENSRGNGREQIGGEKTAGCGNKTSVIERSSVPMEIEDRQHVKLPRKGGRDVSDVES